MQDIGEASAVPINLESRTPLGERNERRSLLLICGAILVLSSALGINTNGQVYLPPFEQFGLPAMCATKVLFHLDCAGCGITRSLVSIGHGNWRDGLAFHPAGLAVYGFLWAQVIFQIVALRCLKRGLPIAQSRFLSWYFYALLAMFFLTGLWRFWPR